MKLRVGLILATMVLGGMLLSGVVLAKNLTGGPGRNNYMGGNGTDTISGGGGSDDLGGKGGPDWLYGDGGKDRLHGGRGDDRVDGGPGSDQGWGDEGKDKLKAVEIKYKGSYQAAKVKGGRKPDKLLGGRGKDTITAKNGKRDIIRGGPGRDTAYVDRVDKVKGVEVKHCSGCTKPPGTKPPGNKPPVAKNDKLTTTENLGFGPNTSSKDIDVIANDTDVDGDTLRISSFTQPSHGDVWANGDGTSVEYAPVEGYSGKDSFTYKATDGAADSNVATVKVTVDPVNQCEDGIDNDGDGKIDFGTGANNDPGCDSLTDDTENTPPKNTPPKNTPPVAKDDSYQLSIENCNGSKAVPLTVDAPNGVLGNDTDADPLKAVEVNPPTHGSILKLNADGSFTYEALDGICPNPDSFTYKATDGAADSNVATVRLNPPPNVP